MNDIPAARLDIERTPDGLRLAGDIDSHTAPELSDAMEDLPASSEVVLDVAEVGFIDSSGLRVLVGAHQKLDGQGGGMQLSNASDAVRRLVKMTGLTDTLKLTD